MTTELKGRYANYYLGDKATGTIERKVTLSLNQVKVNFGMYFAKELLKRKQLTLTNKQWLELVLLPGEKGKDEVIKEEVVKALYQDLKESYHSLTYEWLLTEADKLLAGAKPTGGPGMFLNNYLIKMGLILSAKLKEKTENGR